MTTHDGAPHGRGMAWATLLVSASISLGVNLWHAFDRAPGDHVTWWFAALATLYGTAPVVLAAFQSHSAAFVPMGRAKRTLTYLLVLLGMVLSVQAQAAAVAVFAGDYLKWIFPLLVDLSAFMALHTLMESARVRVRVPSRVPVGEPVRGVEPGPGRMEDARTAVPAAPVQPVGPLVPDRVPVEAGMAGPPQTGAPVRSVPADQTALVPAGGPADRTTPDHPGTADLTSAKVGDTAALDRLDRVFAGTDPAAVSVRQVRKELGAGHARADRLLVLWVARTGVADRGADRSGAEAGTPVDGTDREAGTDGEGEADRTADRVTVPA